MGGPERPAPAEGRAVGGTRRSRQPGLNARPIEPIDAAAARFIQSARARSSVGSCRLIQWARREEPRLCDTVGAMPPSPATLPGVIRALLLVVLAAHSPAGRAAAPA